MIFTRKYYIFNSPLNTYGNSAFYILLDQHFVQTCPIRQRLSGEARLYRKNAQ